MRILESSEGDELRVDELTGIREAADALFFCENLDADDSAREAADLIADLAVDLVESGRWGEETAEELVSEVLACGPVAFAG